MDTNNSDTQETPPEGLVIPTSCVSIIGVPLPDTDQSTWSRYLEQQGVTLQPLDSGQSAADQQPLNVNVINAELLQESQTGQGNGSHQPLNVNVINTELLQETSAGQENGESVIPAEPVTVSVNVVDTGNNTLSLNVTGIDDIQNVEALPRSVLEQLQTAGIITLTHNEVPILPVSEIGVTSVEEQNKTEDADKGDNSTKVNIVQFQNPFVCVEGGKNSVLDISSISQEKDVGQLKQQATDTVNCLPIVSTGYQNDIGVQQTNIPSSIQEHTDIKNSKIFSKIVAFLSEEILAAILGDHSTIADELEKQDDVVWNQSMGQCSITGDLNALMRMQKKIKTMLHADQEYLESEPKIKIDRAVQTETNLKANSSTMCDILVPALSTYGREIKQPARFNPYSDLSLTAIEEDEEPRPRVHRRKRKIQRSTYVPQHNGAIPQINHTAQPQNENTVFSNGVVENTVSQNEVLLTPNDLNLVPQSTENVSPPDDLLEKIEDNPPIPDIGHSVEDADQSDNGDSQRINYLKPKSKKDYESLAPFKFFCNQCSFKTKRQSHFIKHSKLHETASKMYFCKQCDFKTIRCSTLRRHELSHSKVLLQCSECSYKTDAATNLARHIKIKHRIMKHGFKRELKSLYQCSECNYKTVMAARYRKHLETHGSLFEKMKNDPEIRKTTFQCDKCPYKTAQKGHYVRHQKNVHSDHRPYLCDLCGSAFKRPDALTQHKIVHVDKNYRHYAFSCKMCGKGFRSNAHLNEHMAMHSTARQYLCDICGAAFKTKSCQQKHLKSIHHNPRSYTCDHCTKRFNTKYALKRHLRTHEKPGGLITTVQEVIHDDLNHIESQIASNAFQTLHAHDQLQSHDQFDSHDQQQELVQDIMTSSIYDPAIENLRQATAVNESDTAIMYLPNSGF